MEPITDVQALLEDSPITDQMGELIGWLAIFRHPTETNTIYCKRFLITEGTTSEEVRRQAVSFLEGSTFFFGNENKINIEEILKEPQVEEDIDEVGPRSTEYKLQTIGENFFKLVDEEITNVEIAELFMRIPDTITVGAEVNVMLDFDELSMGDLEDLENIENEEDPFGRDIVASFVPRTDPEPITIDGNKPKENITPEIPAEENIEEEYSVSFDETMEVLEEIGYDTSKVNIIEEDTIEMEEGQEIKTEENIEEVLESTEEREG